MTAAPRRVVIVAVEPTDHQAVLEPLSKHDGTRAAAAAAVADGRIVRLHPLRRGPDHVEALGPDVGGLIFRNVSPGICYHPSHVDKKNPMGVAHWDMGGMMDFAAWARQACRDKFEVYSEAAEGWDTTTDASG